MRCRAMIAAVRAPHAVATEARQRGDVTLAEAGDQAVVAVVSELIAQVEDDSADTRSARLLLDLSRPLPVDALAINGWSFNAVRLDALVLLPEIEAIDHLGTIRSALMEAVRLGAPAYNTGDARGCATRYFAAALALAQAPAARGFAGQARALRPLRAVTEELPGAGEGLGSVDDFAWHLRRALDAALAATG